jgi:hypothetical protein
MTVRHVWRTAFGRPIDSAPRLAHTESMPRKIHPDRFVTFIAPHVQVHPATELFQTPLAGGPERKIADIPERRDVYTVGQELQFGSVNAARGFVKAINESAGAQVCRVGKGL